MNFFMRILLLFVLSFSSLFCDEFRDIKTIELKKDEVKKILVKYDDKEKLFKFRWTLYKNGVLVIHRSYDKIVAQNILYLRNKNGSFRLKLKPRGKGYYNVSYLLVKFKEFDYEKKRAIFNVFLSDSSMDIKLKYLKNG
ncbi:MAG: hypothetical protein GXO30_08515 [Epsilonproteobacteria bacterium]|nr:hypothetical protein [Campylobacterota bacterium]